MYINCNMCVHMYNMYMYANTNTGIYICKKYSPINSIEILDFLGEIVLHTDIYRKCRKNST